MGLIPARAGKTYRRGAERSAARAHPRSRGENRGGDACGVVAVGSSPLARGKRAERNLLDEGHWLIPARAGKTCIFDQTYSFCRAHPRSRGENAAYVGDVHPDEGSSPLARGKRQAGNAIGCGQRLIPARAGKTPGFVRLGDLVNGSSPLARGKLWGA